MDKIGKYLIIDKIAKGGMSNVYKVQHPTLESFMILKQLNLKGVEGVVERFKREARIMFNFRSENIVQVYDHFKEGSSYYIVMEYIDGLGLDKVIQTKRHITNEAAVLILMEICKGLKYAHDKGVIHRDIKPANILISKDGEIKLTDFGIAKSEEDDTDGLTLKGTTLGTPSYMAPEQISDSKDVDKRADIFSLGVLFYQMLTGKLPFASDMAAKTIALIEKGKYTKPRRINPHIPPKIQSIVRKMIRKKAKSRYGDLLSVIEKLRPYVRKYRNQLEINNAIRDYVFGDEKSSALKKIPKDGFIGLKIFLSALIIIGALGYPAYYKGYYHEIFTRDRYGKIILTVRIEKNARKNGLSNLKAYLFMKDKNENYREAGTAICRLVSDKNRRNDDHMRYESDEMYLKTGEYYLSLDVIDEKVYREFYVEPIATNDIMNFPVKADEIEILHSEPPILPLDVNFSFYNRSDGSRLYDVAVSVFGRAGWTKWDVYREREKSLLLTDKTYYFKFEKTGYLPRKFTITANRYETVLKLAAELVPKSGVLNLKIPGSGVRVLVDEHDYYYSGGEDRKFIKVNPSPGGLEQFILPAGTHTLTLKQGNSSAKKSFELPPDGTLNASGDYESIGGQIEINIK